MSEGMTYNPQAFLDALAKRRGKSGMPTCPICGGNSYSTSNEFVSLPSGTSLARISLGPSVPCSVVFCTQCGHAEFFSMGVLGLLPRDQKDPVPKEK